MGGSKERLTADALNKENVRLKQMLIESRKESAKHKHDAKVAKAELTQLQHQLEELKKEVGREEANKERQLKSEKVHLVRELDLAHAKNVRLTKDFSEAVVMRNHLQSRSNEASAEL